MARAGEARRWCWKRRTAGTGLRTRWAELGATVHLAHPLGVKMFAFAEGEERRPRRGGSGRSTADGSAARGVDRPTRYSGAPWLGTESGQARRLAQLLEEPDPCRARLVGHFEGGAARHLVYGAALRGALPVGA